MATRLHVLSDLHSEFGDESALRTPADIVVLAGDIGVRQWGLDYAKRQFDALPVIYVAGNHEYYGAAIPHLTEKLRAASAGTNIHFLENEAIVLNGVRFLGCTLWTDMCLLGLDRLPVVLEEAKRVMTDCRRIRRSPQYRKFNGKDMAHFHRLSVEWLTAQLAVPHDGPTVVVTHHAPSVRSLAENYRDDLLCPVYASDMDAFIEQSGVALWVHGHTHRCVDYHIGRTRVISNQRGYPGEMPEGFRADLVAEVA